MKNSILLSVLILFSVNSFATDEYLIKVADPIEDSTIRGLKKVRDNLYVVSKKRLPLLRQQLRIAEINPNHKIIPYNVPDDLLSEQWGIQNLGSSGVDANIVPAWLKTTGSKDVVVAITDTGMDIDHPDLKDNLWKNTTEIDGIAGVDDDGNGFIDDFHGWNMAENSNVIYDQQRHGTHVAGIVGARGNNGTGLVGVNWEVSLMAIPFIHRSKDTTVADAIRAIDYAVENGAHIINASWGTDYDPAEVAEFTLLSEAIQRAADKNVIFVAAAGNSGHNNDFNGSIPASLSNSNILSVGAITRNGWPPGFSNYGATSVDVFAPGSTIKSTLPGGYYGNLNGTSMAAPFVSGVLALLLAVDPDLSVSQMVKRVTDTCQENSNLTNSCVCKGHIDADHVLSP